VKNKLTNKDLLKVSEPWFVFSRPAEEGELGPFQIIKTTVGRDFIESIAEHMLSMASAAVYSIGNAKSPTHMIGLFHDGKPLDGRIRFVSKTDRWFKVYHGFYEKNEGVFRMPFILSEVKIERY
jgi:hypothetical protein